MRMACTEPASRAFRKPEDFDTSDYRRSSPRFSDENFASNFRLVEIVSQIAREEGYTPAQVALAWLLDCAPYIVPMPGTRSVRRLKENALAYKVRLGDTQLARLYGILRERPVSGARYAAASMATIDAGNRCSNFLFQARGLATGTASGRIS